MRISIVRMRQTWRRCGTAPVQPVVRRLLALNGAQAVKVLASRLSGYWTTGPRNSTTDRRAYDRADAPEDERQADAVGETSKDSHCHAKHDETGEDGIPHMNRPAIESVPGLHKPARAFRYRLREHVDDQLQFSLELASTFERRLVPGGFSKLGEIAGPFPPPWNFDDQDKPRLGLANAMDLPRLEQAR